ncbi:MAG: hypothetical protein Q8K04_12340 [Lutibacter sp.]|nr:hypothetical protein [Lutibacter sp.]
MKNERNRGWRFWSVGDFRGILVVHNRFLRGITVVRDRLPRYSFTIAP